jgi:spermidine synthase
MEPPEQRGVFTDADALSAITRFDGDTAPLGYLDYITSAAPYHLLPAPTTLILGAGAGEQVLLAILHGVPKIVAVELNPQIVQLVRGDYADFAGGIYGRAEVEVRIDEARSAVRRSNAGYDLIQLPLLNSFGTATAGTQSLHENYTYTVEAMTDYVAALEPGGILSITLWLKLPPRDSVKLFATTVEALRREGVAEPGAQLAMIRSWNTATMLVKNGAFVPHEIAALRDFATARAFDVDWAPGLKSAETNRFNILERPYLYEAATVLLGPDPQEFFEDYKFAVTPATDDRPYFYDFFKWRFLPELLGLGPQGAAALLDMGYLILAATLVQAAALSAVLILAPLALRRGLGEAAPRARVVGYFLALGFGFLFLEIAFIQRFILFLGHPLYAVAVVLAGFLVFAGIGSAIAPRLDRRIGGRVRPIAIAAAAVAALATAYLVALPPLFEALIGLAVPGRIMITLTLIAPLAVSMGMPFPLGIVRVARDSGALVPWAWGINGCASVVAAVLATLLAIHLGFTAVVLIAVALYLAAPLAFASRCSSSC